MTDRVYPRNKTHYRRRSFPAHENFHPLRKSTRHKTKPRDRTNPIEQSPTNNTSRAETSIKPHELVNRRLRHYVRAIMDIPRMANVSYETALLETPYAG